MPRFAKTAFEGYLVKKKDILLSTKTFLKEKCMPTITKVKIVSKQEARVNVINSISQRYKEERQESKAPTFLL